MFSEMLRRDRERSGLRVAQMAWRLGINPAAYRRLEEEAAWPSFETYDRICKLFGWPQTFSRQTMQIWDGDELLKTVLRTNGKEVRKKHAARAS
jgi:transcriptional regulator with XRE-family HTH domain